MIILIKISKRLIELLKDLLQKDMNRVLSDSRWEAS